jgi:hypothetical protein
MKPFIKLIQIGKTVFDLPLCRSAALPLCQPAGQ